MKRMGEIIKEKRKENNLSQEELGQRLTPPVNKAAVNKWENGSVENIKRTHIQQLARLFDISPCELMAWESDSTPSDPKKKFKDGSLSDEQIELIQLFSSMNANGQKALLSYATYIADQPEYQNNKKESLNA